MKPLLILAAVAALAACTTSSGSLFEDTLETQSRQAAPAPDPIEETGEPVQAAEDEEQWDQAYYEAQATAGEGVEILSDPDGAQVYLDGRWVGTTPLVLRGIPRGRYRLTVTKPGYYPFTTWISHSGDYSAYNLSLTRITGFLRVQVRPPDALVTVGSEPYEPGRVAELPVGQHAVRARAFGYEEQRQTVVVRERRLTELSLTLAKAEFRVSALAANRSRFNPLNAGALGTVRVTFEVSSFGSAAAVILDEAGREVHRTVFEGFTTWEQQLTWDGRGPDGRRVPDGPYTIRLRAVGEPDGTIVEREQVVRVDSSLVLSYRSLLSGSAGLLYAPSPDVLPGGSFQLSTLVLAHWQSGAGATLVRVPVAIGARWGIAGRTGLTAGDHGAAPFSHWELDVQAGSLVGYSDTLGESSLTFPFFASAALKTPLFDPTGSVGPRAGLQAKLAYQGVSTDTLANSTGLSVGAPLALQLGAVRLLLEPELILSPWRVSYDPAAERAAGFYSWLYARTGVLVDLGVLTAGLSASLRSTPFGEAFALDLPFQAAAELHWLLPRSSVFLSFAFAGEFSPPESYYLQGGIGIGLLH
ncbi:MAG: PEGA domain-containing protein [Spirochaetales bacterium]|nr:PEGA domain-containing protein [Spirochaetales bacterium]